MKAKSVAVWDPLIRIGHWLLVVAFATAYLSAESAAAVHVAAGYCVGAYVVLRLIWGFVGTRHARFADFVRGPRAVFGYLDGLRRGRAPRYLGHNPAGGAMVVALLLMLAATATAGIVTQAAVEHEGPLAGWFATPAGMSEAEAEDAGEVYEEVHETLANLTLVLIGLHLAGVLASSIAHRENLPRAMLSGRKRPPDA